MIFKEWIRFIYGMAMGTSVPYIKPTNRFMWPTTVQKIDDHLSVFLGGSCVCGILKDQKQCILINTNSGAAAEQLQKFTSQDAPAALVVFNTSFARDFSGGNRLYPQGTQFYLPNFSESALSVEWPIPPAHIEKISSEKTFELADETFVVVPIFESASHCDLAIFLRKRKVLFLGALFYNHIHPTLRPFDGMNVKNWIRNLEELQRRFQPETFVPAEGDPSDVNGLLDFISYLKALSNPQIEFSDCRKNYDWVEIPGQTSLEENFDLLRENIKSFAKF